MPSTESGDRAFGDDVREWHFFTTLNIETTSIDLGAGNDTYRADGGFQFEGDDSLTTWGIEEGDLQAGAEAFANDRGVRR